ncbi:hypothetical protein SeKA_A0373 [Salmonella enterica subsp. enterica serovar Kentucky str. CVM29188]|nr:hypothetical protein SeKA_A0373 [Salmonella enterica subsp. enterica serovar Kentucky str. CVM29188]EDZ21478.1 hypothetical protein SeKB_A1016 [Salmonella enterica subsp. enterica serovar Kentucky str. CDC 191]
MMTQFTSALSAYREHNAIRLTLAGIKKPGAKARFVRQ